MILSLNGYNENYSNSLLSIEENNFFTSGMDIEISNPLSKDMKYLRKKIESLELDRVNQQSQNKEMSVIMNALQSKVIEVSDQDFLQLKWHGDGSQKWRPVSLFFMPEKVIWVMDSPIQKAYLQIFDRKDGSITEGQYFPGPVWYSKQFESGDAVLQTSVEIGDEVKSKDSIIFYSNNLVDWEEVYRFKKDFLPMPFFKFGVIAFADGKQSKDDFVLFGEALSFLDGVAIKASIK